jgi:signal transduction histidine kinase/CheY-like chemotaxis protein
VIRSAKSVLRATFNLFGSLFSSSDSSKIKNKLLLQHNELIQEEREARKRLEQEFEKYKLELNNLVEQRTQELQKEKERAESLDKQKSLFLASMSHEIRTPLSGISGLAELMKDTDLQPIQKEFLNKIESSSNHLLEIINNILDISKIEAGHLEMENKPFSIFKLIKEVVDFAHVKNRHQQLDIIMDEDIGCDHLILGDAMRLKQVLLNLVSNAIKFTEKGNIIVRIKQLDTESAGVTFKFSVVDTGIGIKKADLAVLFREFKQVGVGSDNAYGGTGLGLSISFSFVEKMGGRLRVDSEINEGSTFSFTLNFEQSTEIDPHAFVSEMSQGNLQKSILLINYTPLEVQLLTRDLKRIGFTNLMAVPTIDEAAIILKKEAVDLGILNLSNYTPSFLDEFSEMRNASKQNIHWIAITTSKRSDLAEKSTKYGIEQIILKPFTKSDFQRVIHSTFNKALSKKEIEKLETGPSKARREENKLKNILVAEDDPINQMVIKRVLEREGYTVLMSSNGEECIDLFESGPQIDLILMDVQMPKLNGLEATKIIRSKKRGAKTPILAFTADVTPQMQNRINDYGLNGSISKPIDFNLLREILSKWIP